MSKYQEFMHLLYACHGASEEFDMFDVDSKNPKSFEELSRLDKIQVDLYYKLHSFCVANPEIQF